MVLALSLGDSDSAGSSHQSVCNGENNGVLLSLKVDSEFCVLARDYEPHGGWHVGYGGSGQSVSIRLKLVGTFRPL